MKFSPPGTEIVVVVGADANMGVLAVMDEGPGVDGADPEHLFGSSTAAHACGKVGRGGLGSA